MLKRQTVASASNPVGRPIRVVILVQNLPVPFDRRVWQEATTLASLGYEVEVICPSSRVYKKGTERLESVLIRRYPVVPEGNSALGYIWEYLNAALWFTVLLLRARLKGRIDIVQACNPPDFLFLFALPFKIVDGAAFVFDHHDVCPELALAKGSRPNSMIVKLMKMLERATFRFADVSIATNGSYRAVAVNRGGMADADVFVVRSGVAANRFSCASVNPKLKRGRQHLITYLGVMGKQEGIDYLIDAAHLLLLDGRNDFSVTLIGDGPERIRLERHVRALGLEECIQFVGRIPDSELGNYLATADICVNPDEHNEMNSMSTMNKVLEYMSFGKPIVQFDLVEGRYSAGTASVYCGSNSAAGLADAINELLDDPNRRSQMGEEGRRRIKENFTWEHQAPILKAAYARAACKIQSRKARSQCVERQQQVSDRYPAMGPGPDCRSRQYIS